MEGSIHIDPVTQEKPRSFQRLVSTFHYTNDFCLAESRRRAHRSAVIRRVEYLPSVLASTLAVQVVAWLKFDPGSNYPGSG